VKKEIFSKQQLIFWLCAWVELVESVIIILSFGLLIPTWSADLFMSWSKPRVKKGERNG